MFAPICGHDRISLCKFGQDALHRGVPFTFCLSNPTFIVVMPREVLLSESLPKSLRIHTRSCRQFNCGYPSHLILPLVIEFDSVQPNMVIRFIEALLGYTPFRFEIPGLTEPTPALCRIAFQGGGKGKCRSFGSVEGRYAQEDRGYGWALWSPHPFARKKAKGWGTGLL